MDEKRLKEILALDDSSFAAEADKIFKEVKKNATANNTEVSEENTRNFLNKNSKLDLYSSFKSRVLEHNINFLSKNNLKTQPIVFDDTDSKTISVDNDADNEIKESLGLSDDEYSRFKVVTTKFQTTDPEIIVAAIKGGYSYSDGDELASVTKYADLYNNKSKNTPNIEAEEKSAIDNEPEYDIPSFVSRKNSKEVGLGIVNNEEKKDTTKDKNITINENKNNTKNHKFGDGVIGGIVGALFVAGLGFGLQSCSSQKEIQPTPTPSATAKAVVATNENQETSQFAQNEEQMINNAAQVMNETRAYGNDATAEEMYKFMLLANYQDIKNDNAFLQRLCVTPGDDMSEDLFKNFVGYYDSIDANGNYQGFHGITGKLITSYIQETYDEDVVSNKKLTDFSILFADQKDQDYIKQFMGYMNDAVYNSSDKTKVTTDIKSASQFLLDEYKNEKSEVSPEAKLFATLLYNGDMRGLFANYTESDQVTVDMLKLCDEIIQGKSNISINAKNSLIEVRDDAGSLSNAFKSFKESACKITGKNTYAEAVAELESKITAKYVSLDDLAAKLAAKNGLTAKNYTVEYGTGENTYKQVIRTWTKTETTTSVNKFKTQDAQEKANQVAADAQNAETQAKAAEANDKNSVITGEHQVTSSSGHESGKGTGVSISQDGSVVVSHDDGTKTVVDTTGETAEEINKQIEAATGDSKAGEEPVNKVVTDENGNKQVETTGQTIGEAIKSNEEEVKKAQEDAEKIEQDLTDDGFTKVNSVESSQMTKDTNNISVQSTAPTVTISSTPEAYSVAPETYAAPAEESVQVESTSLASSESATNNDNVQGANVQEETPTETPTASLTLGQ
jgi:hypothetical protein